MGDEEKGTANVGNNGTSNEAEKQQFLAGYLECLKEVKSFFSHHEELFSGDNLSLSTCSQFISQLNKQSEMIQSGKYCYI